MQDKTILETDGICIAMTADYALRHDLWDSLCTLKDLNPWSVSEGMDRNTQYELTTGEALQMGLFDKILHTNIRKNLNYIY